MPRQRRAENRGLPERWQFEHGAYYYRVPPGEEHQWDGYKRFPLGKSLAAAYAAYAARVDIPDRITTIGSLLDRYSLQVVPTKAPKTQTGNRIFIKALREAMGKWPLSYIRPQHVYQYRDKRGGVIAHREIEVLSHAFTKAVEWGLIDRHPFKGQVRLEGEKPRDRYIEDWELLESLALPAVRKRGSVLMIQAYIRIKMLTGLAQGDLLRLEPGRHFKEDGIHVTRHKTGKRSVYEWSDELRDAVVMAKAARPVDLSPFLFCNKRGEGYVDETNGEARGWRSMWQRFMDRLLAETKITVRYTEHDLRAKVASDAESLERARALLQHADSRTTDAIYRRKPERVRPVR